MTTPDPRRTGISWTTLTGWSGVVFVVVFLASIMFVADGPTLNDSAADLRRWFEDNEAQVAWTTWSGGLSLAVFFLVFASGLRSLLGLADASDEGVWARLSFAGAVLIVAIGGVKAAFWAVLGLEDLRSAASDETIKNLGRFRSGHCRCDSAVGRSGLPARSLAGDTAERGDGQMAWVARCRDRCSVGNRDVVAVHRGSGELPGSSGISRVHRMVDVDARSGHRPDPL